MSKGLQVKELFKVKFVSYPSLSLQTFISTPSTICTLWNYPCKRPPSVPGKGHKWKHRCSPSALPNPNRATMPRGGCRTFSLVLTTRNKEENLCKASQVFLNAYHFCSFLVLEGKPVSLAQHSKSFTLRYNMVWSPTHRHQDHDILLVTVGQFPLYIWDQQNVE